MMGRKAKELTEEQRIQVEALAAVLSQEQIADYFGIGKTTWFSIIERDSDVLERYKRGKAKAIGSVANGLLQKARNGDTASAIFYLKTQAGWRETMQISGDADNPLKIERIERVVIGEVIEQRAIEKKVEDDA